MGCDFRGGFSGDLVAGLCFRFCFRLSSAPFSGRLYQADRKVQWKFPRRGFQGRGPGIQMRRGHSWVLVASGRQFRNTGLESPVNPAAAGLENLRYENSASGQLETQLFKEFNARALAEGQPDKAVFFQLTCVHRQLGQSVLILCRQKRTLRTL